MPIRKLTGTVLLAAMLAGAPPARAQQPMECIPQPTGTVVCQPQARPSGKRLAIIAAVAVGVAVVVWAIHRHKKHAGASAPAQPQQSTAPTGADRKVSE